MSKIQFAITAIAFLFINSVLAQNTAPNWASFNLAKGDNSDRYNQIIADGSGNFLGVGYTFRSGNYRDFLVVKLNANGDTIWTRTKIFPLGSTVAATASSIALPFPFFVLVQTVSPLAFNLTTKKSR